MTPAARGIAVRLPPFRELAAPKGAAIEIAEFVTKYAQVITFGAIFRARVQGLVINFLIISANSALELLRGKGRSGTGSLRNRHNGAQPSPS